MTTARQRFLDVLNRRQPVGRMPMIEWAAWWDKTVERWGTEGLDVAGKTSNQIEEMLGLDPMAFLFAAPRLNEALLPHEGEPVVPDADAYEALRPHLFSQSAIDQIKAGAMAMRERQERGEIVVRLWLDGFFWFPRTLFGIEKHLFAFYDEPALMHRMNEDLLEFSLRVVRDVFPILRPDMIGCAEDMSYNHGPMLSKALFDEFIAPYYRRLIPAIHAAGVKVFLDSDGNITTMVPWFQEVGIDGIYPLERQAGVDLVYLRKTYPDFLFMGGYDKMVMPRGEAAMRAEFERLLPVMRSGGYIPSVDHQTPPGVSLANYRIYLRLFAEYARKAVE